MTSYAAPINPNSALDKFIFEMNKCLKTVKYDSKKVGKKKIYYIYIRVCTAVIKKYV